MRSIFPLLAGAALALLLLPGRADAVECSVEAGLGGYLVPGAWTPVVVRVRVGPDEAPLAGRVVLERRRQQLATVSAAIEAAPGEERVVRLVAPAEPGETYAVRVVGPGSAVLARATPERLPTYLDPTTRLALVLGEDQLLALTGDKDAGWRVARLAAGELPLDVRLLEGVSAVVLPAGAGAALAELARDPRAVAALRDYVAGGGQLVLVAQGGAASWSGTPLERELLPASLAAGDERGEAPVAALAALVGAGDDAEETTGRVELVHLVPRPWARDGEADPGPWPLVVTGSPPGLAGRVAVLAFDLDHPLVRQAPGLGAFVGGTLVPPRAGKPAAPRTGAVVDLASAAFEAVAPVSPAGFALIALAVVVYALLLGPVTSRLSRRRGPWGALLVPPALATGLAGAIVLVAWAGRSQARHLELETTFAGPGEAGVRHLDVGLVGRSRAQLRLPLPPGLRPADQPAGGLGALDLRGPAPGLELGPGDEAVIAPISLSGGALLHLHLTGPPPRGPGGPLPLRATLRVAAGDGSSPGGGWPLLELESLAGAPLDGLHVLAVGPPTTRAPELRRVRLEGPLAPGEVRRVELGAASQPWPVRPPLPDPFAGPLTAEVEDGLLARLGAILAEQLELELSLQPGTNPDPGRVYPAAWVVRLEQGPEGALRALDEAGQPLPVTRIRQAVVVAGRGR